MASLIFSPYNDPFYANPLAPLLADHLPPAALAKLNRNGSPRLHVCAVNVGNNQRKIFTQPEISIDALLASACVPNQFKAIEIGDKVYWDGGYIGNPPLEPLLKSCEDIIIVLVNPLRVSGVPPRYARQILDRLNEITFNTPLVLEINAIHAINKLLGRLPAEQAKVAAYKHIRLHFIRNDKFMEPLGFVGKDNASPIFLGALFDAGRETADTWLERHHKNIGTSSTCHWKVDPCRLEEDIVDPMLKGE